MPETTLLRIRGLKTNFYTYQGIVRALDGVDLDMAKGEILGVVGETGCGKSVTALSILRLIPSPPGKVEAGEALFDVPAAELAKLEALRGEVRTLARELFGASSSLATGPLNVAALQQMAGLVSRAPQSVKTERKQDALAKLRALREMLLRYDLLSKTEAQLRAIRGNSISMIFQEPMQALNPVFQIGDQIAESILLHRPKSVYRKVVLRMRREALRARVVSALLETFRGRQDLPAGVDLESPTRADLQAVWVLLSLEARRGSILPSLRELIELEDALGEEATKRSVYSRWLPKSLQSRLYADLWARSGWRASDVLDALQTLQPRLWSDARARDDVTVALTPGDGGPDKAAKALSEAMRREHGSPAWAVLARVLEPPRAEDGSVVLRVRKSYRASTHNPALVALNRVPALRRAVNHAKRRQALDEAAEMLRALKIPDPERVIQGYPHELSGGMQQRALIAIALSCNPLLLIADEPTTALDVTIQAQILALLKELKRQGRPSILIITHDLGVIADMCDRVAVMYGGVVVEDAPAREIFKNPKHPYTQGLIKAIPSHTERRDRLAVIRGSVPNLIYPPGGCRFHPRCPVAMPHCGWDPRDLEAAVRGYLQEIGLGPEAAVTYESAPPTTLRVEFGEGTGADKAEAHLRARMDAERGGSPLLQAVTEVVRSGRALTFTLTKSRRPQHLEVGPGHRVSCYLYEPAPGGPADA